MPHTTIASSPSRLRATALLVAVLMGLGACSNMSTTQQRTLTGAAIGTTVGAATIAMTGGCVACGAALGGAVGAGTGYLYDYVDNKGY